MPLYNNSMHPSQYLTPRLSDFSPPKQRARLLDQTSDEVVRYSMQRLQSLLVKESNVEERLEGIESAAGGYRMKQKTLQDKIFLYRAVLAPVRKLSIEVLVVIFGFLLASSPDDIRNVGLVCDQWRSATLASSALWSHIVITRECPALERKVILFSNRSNIHLLKISYSQSIDASRRWLAWDSLLSTAPRWSTVSLTFDDCRSAFLRIHHLSCSPLLQELSITIRRQSLRSNHEGKYGFDHYDMAKTPNLRSLILSTHVLPRTTITCLWFSKLTRLHITDTFAGLVTTMNMIEPMHGNHVLDVLRACPMLEDFYFQAENSSQWFRAASPSMDVLGWPVQLPNLHRLHITCHYTVGYCLLDYITRTESLEDVTLRLLPRYQSLTQPKLETTARMFLISCPRIRSLSLYGVNHRAILAGIKHGLQELQELHLKHVSGIEDIPQLDEIACCLLQDPTKPDEESWCAPRLSNIIIDANWNDVPFNRLAIVIKARYSANLRHRKPLRIQSLVVNGQNLLDGAAPGDVMEYKRLQRLCFSLKPFE